MVDIIFSYLRRLGNTGWWVGLLGLIRARYRGRIRVQGLRHWYTGARERWYFIGLVMFCLWTIGDLSLVCYMEMENLGQVSKLCLHGMDLRSYLAIAALGGGGRRFDSGGGRGNSLARHRIGLRGCVEMLVRKKLSHLCLKELHSVSQNTGSCLHLPQL